MSNKNVVNLHRAVLTHAANETSPRSPTSNTHQYAKPGGGLVTNQNRHTVALTSSDQYSIQQQQKHLDTVDTLYGESSNWIMPIPGGSGSGTCSSSGPNSADYLSESDLLDSTNNTGAEGDDISYDDEPDSGGPGSGGGGLNGNGTASLNLFNDRYDDYTTKRLKTFVTTTLHNERSYLLKIKKVLDFKAYLEEHSVAAGCSEQTDLIVLFTGIDSIYKTHDIVAFKLEDYLRSINDLLVAASGSRSATSQTMKESFLSNALQLLANIMEISFPVYYDFLRNYSKAMTILDKLERQTPAGNINSSKRQQQQRAQNGGGCASGNQRKSFLECKVTFFGKAPVTHRQQTENSPSNFF